MRYLLLFLCDGGCYVYGAVPVLLCITQMKARRRVCLLSGALVTSSTKWGNQSCAPSGGGRRKAPETNHAAFVPAKMYIGLTDF